MPDTPVARHRPVGDPGMAIVIDANAALTNPATRDQIRAMHAQGLPLLQMVDQLGLAGVLSPEVRAILEGLPADVVAGIRQATVAMLDSTEFVMPIDCRVTQNDLSRGTQVNVSVGDELGRPTIRVTPTTGV
jgi:hypothetical protein